MLHVQDVRGCCFCMLLLCVDKFPICHHHNVPVVLQGRRFAFLKVSGGFKWSLQYRYDDILIFGELAGGVEIGNQEASQQWPQLSYGRPTSTLCDYNIHFEPKTQGACTAR